MTGAVILRTGTASGNLVEAHIIVRMYWCSELDFGKGPTQSTITLLNGSPITGIGDRGAGWITWYGLSTIWQTWQV